MSDTGGHRLSGAGFESTGDAVQFRFEGEPIAALEGESLAAALTAAGHLGLRQHGPSEQRGIFCGMGACQDCLVEIDGRGAQRACMTRIAPGMEVRRHNPGLAQLKPLAPRPEKSPAAETCDVAIIGAGPAGLNAALVLGRAGTKVIVVDERDLPGGQFYKPLAPSHRFTHGGEDRQFAAGRRLLEAVQSAGVDIRSRQSVWHAENRPDAGPSLGILADGHAYTLKARAVLIATGAYEMPWHVPGWTLPGVMAAGAGQTLARAYRVAPGKRVLVAGNGPLNWQLALEIAKGGGTVLGVLESAAPGKLGHIMPVLGMLASSPRLALGGLAMRLALMRHGIIVHEGVRIAALEGDQRVERAVAEPVSGRGNRLSFDVDAVCLGYGFIPNTDIARMLGCPVTIDAQSGYPRPVRQPDGRSGTGPVWIAGDAGGIGGSELALADATIAAAAMLAHLGYADKAAGKALAQAGRNKARGTAFQSSLWSVFAEAAPRTQPAPQAIVCRCENVTAATISAMRDAGVRDLGSLKRQTRLGMGRCQGRYCAGAALRLLRQGDLSGTTEADLFAPQAPAKPVPAMALLSEKPEWGGHREVATHLVPPLGFSPDPLPARCDLLVIGAGITGTCTAMYAARDGIDVVVLDRADPNSQASGGNAGSLHVQLLSWDFGKKAMAGGNPALETLPLQRDSVALWTSLEHELAADFEIVTTGGLMVAENSDQTAFLREKAARERQAGVDVEVIGRAELAQLAPAVSERMTVAAYCAAEGKINPLKATPVIVNEARRHGARFLAGHNVCAIAEEGDGYRVSSGSGSILARRIVIAAGGWSRHIGHLAGVDLPISGAPLQMLVTEPTRPMLKQLIAHADRHLTMKQASNGNLIIGGAWTAGTDPASGYSRVLRSSIEGNLWVAERTVPVLAGLHLLRSWAAMNVNIDGAPLLGEIPGRAGIYIAATANGYTLGPMMGRLTAELIKSGRTHRSIDGFTLARFN